MPSDPCHAAGLRACKKQQAMLNGAYVHQREHMPPSVAPMCMKEEYAPPSVAPMCITCMQSILQDFPINTYNIHSIFSSQS